MPKRISARVTELMTRSSSRWPALTLRTLALGRSLRYSEMTLESSNQPVNRQPFALPALGRVHRRDPSRSQFQGPNRHGNTTWRDVGVAMRRRLQRLNQQLAAARSLQTPERLDVDRHNGIAAVQGDMLRAFAMRQAHEFAEPGLGFLQAATAAGTGFVRQYCEGAAAFLVTLTQ